MRVLVCGGRDYDAYHILFSELDDLYEIHPDLIIIQGGQETKIPGRNIGADYLAKIWAHDRQVPCLQYDAEWRKYGRSAGPKRNQRMLDEGTPGLVLAFPGGRGTADMVRRARKAGVEVREIEDVKRL